MMLCEKEKCTGCMACFNICQHHAIKMLPDEEGFLYPRILKDSCLNCGQCTRACPQLKSTVNAPSDEKKVFAGWQRSKKVLKRSTSGGAFTALAITILEKNGVVYGAGFDEQLKVIHKRVTSATALDELRGSKYVQSEIGTTFSEVRSDLKNGKSVLFSGTPCQIEGLYNFLGRRYQGQLFTIDLVCHGVPSPKVFSTYLDYMREKYNSKPIGIYFRNKKPGWYVFGMKLLFADGQIYENDTYHDPYIRGFLRNYYLRPSCSQCKYCNTNRPADITLADDWGYQERGFFDHDNDQGISMIMINSENGLELFNKARNNLHVFDRTVQEAVNGNQALSKCFSPHADREQFWNDFGSMTFEHLIDKYLYPEDIPEWIISRRKNILINRKNRTKEIIAHFPNRIAMKVIGEERYSKLKQILKG